MMMKSDSNSGAIETDAEVGQSSSRSVEYAQFFRDDVTDFGLKLSHQASLRMSEHAHENLQISVPLGKTLLEAQWRNAAGRPRQTAAARGHVVIIPPHLRHAIFWNGTADFVNIHVNIGALTSRGRDLLNDRLFAASVHLVEDAFLAVLGENIVAAAMGAAIDRSVLRGLRPVVEAHVIRHLHSWVNRAPRRALKRSEVICPKAERPLARSTEGEAEADALPPGRQPQPGLASWHLRKVTRAVEADLRRDWSVSELAALVSLSKGHFSRAFRVSTGLSPRQWIIQRRIELALEKLARTDETLAEIAQACGFAEQSHFTRKFSQLTGTSPGAWRRAHKP